MNMYIIEDVFNEAKYPEITFVEPAEYKHIASSLRSQGKHITISGPSGSGKSTLVTKLLLDFKVEEKDIIKINGRSYAGSQSIFIILGSLLGVAPNYQSITPYLQMVKFVVIDDFHFLPYSARIQLAKNLKLWHEDKVRFILIGIASSASELIGEDAELGIRNDPHELKTQSGDFVKELIKKGENALNIGFSEPLRSDIVKASNGVPSVVHVICRNACIEAGITDTTQGDVKEIILDLKEIKGAVLRAFDAKYFPKVMALAKGKQQAKSVHNTYFDIIDLIAKCGKSEIPIEYLYEKIVSVIQDPKQRSKKATSFYNCTANLGAIIDKNKLQDILIYSKGEGCLSIEDPSFRFYLDLLDIDKVKRRISIRNSDYPYDIAVSFSGDMRDIVKEFVDKCRDKGLDVFYDFDQKAQLWGKDLRATLSEVYANEAEYMIVFLSEKYPEKDWPSFELAIGKDAQAKRTKDYLLPIRCDDVHVVGLKETVGYMDIRKNTIDEIVETLVNKINK